MNKLICFYPYLLKLLFLLFIPTIAFSQIPDPKPHTYINDFTGSLSGYQIKTLNDSLYSLEQRTTVQVAMVLVNHLPRDMPIEDYAREIGREWHVGKASNGIVYVAALDEHKQRLEIASRLEGDIPDITAYEFTENLKPALRQKDYFSALMLMISQISNQLDPNRNSAVPSTNENSSIDTNTQTSDETEDKELNERLVYEREKAKYDHYGNIVSWFLVAGALGFTIWAWRYRKKYIASRTIDGVYMGIGSSYYGGGDGGYDDADSGSGDSIGYGGWSGGGGFSGGGATNSW